MRYRREGINDYVHGDWNAQCDRCGGEFKASQLQLEWTGLRVCPYDFEPKHPQLSVRGRRDRQAPPWTRPESDAYFVGDTEVTQDGYP